MSTADERRGRPFQCNRSDREDRGQRLAREGGTAVTGLMLFLRSRLGRFLWITLLTTRRCLPGGGPRDRWWRSCHSGWPGRAIA